MAAEDAKRLGGELPNSFSPGKRVMLVRRPRGVVGVISPWNWPYTMPAELIAPALACGNTVVWTPAPSTAVCAVALARCIAEADLPPGVFNLVTGPGPVVGNEIAAQPRRPTASPSSARPRPGGSSPRPRRARSRCWRWAATARVVVMDDADVDAAVEATLTACYLCAGQSCTAGERILVHRAVRDEYVEKLARRVTERILLGDPFDDATTMGPVNNEPVAAKMDEHVADAVDARRERGRRRRARRAASRPTLYWQPTMLADVPADARVATEETFGPIAPVVAIDSLEQAIELTNASPYGLLVGDLHRRPRRAGCEFADRVRTGWVNINESSNYWEAHLPFGGRCRHRQRHRPRRRRARDALVHRAADRRADARRPRTRQRTVRISRSNVMMCSPTMSRARVGVAVGDRVQHVVVFVHAREQVRQTVDHQVPDAQREVEVAAERLLEVRVAGAAVDEPVHARVQLHQRLAVVEPWLLRRARRAAPRVRRAGRR